jgi:hypothetical protein
LVSQPGFPVSDLNHRRMARGGHGLPQVSPGHAMSYLSTPCGRATSETTLWPFQGWPTCRAGCLLRIWTPHAVRLWSETGSRMPVGHMSSSVQHARSKVFSDHLCSGIVTIKCNNLCSFLNPTFLLQSFYLLFYLICIYYITMGKKCTEQRLKVLWLPKGHVRSVVKSFYF